MFVYRTSLSAAFMNSLSPLSVELKYHLQKALFKFSLGYSFKAIKALPFSFMLASIWSTMESSPNCLRMVLKTCSLVYFILTLSIIKELVRTFLMVLREGFYGKAFRLISVKATCSTLKTFLLSTRSMLTAASRLLRLSSWYCSVIAFKNSSCTLR